MPEVVGARADWVVDVDVACDVTGCKVRIVGEVRKAEAVGNEATIGSKVLLVEPHMRVDEGLLDVDEGRTMSPPLVVAASISIVVEVIGIVVAVVGTCVIVLLAFRVVNIAVNVLGKDCVAVVWGAVLVSQVPNVALAFETVVPNSVAMDASLVVMLVFPAASAVVVEVIGCTAVATLGFDVLVGGKGDGAVDGFTDSGAALLVVVLSIHVRAKVVEIAAVMLAGTVAVVEVTAVVQGIELVLGLDSNGTATVLAGIGMETLDGTRAVAIDVDIIVVEVVGALNWLEESAEQNPQKRSQLPAIGQVGQNNGVHKSCVALAHQAPLRSLMHVSAVAKVAHTRKLQRCARSNDI